MDAMLSVRARNIKAYSAETALPVKLDANESPYELPAGFKREVLKEIGRVAFNRYPDSEGKALKEALSAYTGVPTNGIALGCGSDELLFLVMQCFLDPGDKVLLHTPTFSMYSKFAHQCGAGVVEFQAEDLLLDPLLFIEAAQKEKAKLTVLCNPNNPTGQYIEADMVGELAGRCGGMLLVDEAYYEFCGETAVKLLKKHQNLIILRTLSKAFGLAAARVGYLLGNPAVVEAVDRMRAPYNLNTISQAVACMVVSNSGTILKNVQWIMQERERMRKRLVGLEGVCCLPSRGNFLLVRWEKCGLALKELKKNGIGVRDFKEKALADCIRITIGTRQENQKVMEILEALQYGDEK